MVLPLIPIIAGGLGIGSGFGIASFLDKGKKEQHIAQPSKIDIHAPTEAWQYSPTQIFAPTTQYQIRSPGAQQTSKKVIETISKPSQTLTPSITPSITPTAGVGEQSSILPIVVVAVVGVIAYGYVKGKGKGKKK